MSTANGLSTFAVLGSGAIGQPIIEAFLDAKLPLTILTRDASKPDLQEYARRGASLKSVDYSSVDSIAQALTGIDTFVSALGNHHAPSLPEDLVLAAKKAGVKVFVPSEWGLDYANPKTKPFPALIQAKLDHHAFIESQGLGWIAISNGAFGSWLFHPVLGWDLAKKSVVVRGPTSTPLTVTDTRDIGSFLVRVLTTQPAPAAGTGRVYRVEGYSTTVQDILAEIKRQTGDDFTVTQGPYDEVASKQTDSSVEGFLAWLQATLSDGRQKLQDIDNDAVGFKPKYTLADNVRDGIAAGPQQFA